jgi:hypothetical protein
MRRQPLRGTLALAAVLAIAAGGSLGVGCGGDSGTTGATRTGGVPRGREEQKRFRHPSQGQPGGETTAIEPAP